MISDIAFVAEPLNYFRTHEGTVRSKAAAGAGNIAEDYRGLGERLCSARFPADLVDRPCDETVDFWIDRMKNGRKIDFKSNREVYPIAKSIDHKLKRRVLKKLPAYLLR